VALSALDILPRAESPAALQAENPALFAQVETAYQQGTFDAAAAGPELKALYENTVDPGVMYPKLMMRFLPAGLVGLLIAVFLAAYSSTIASQLNWGTSYLINDFYKRFIRKKADERHYVLVSRIGIILMVLFSLVVTRFFLSTISGAWEFIINASAGMGLVLILRWFWWRINAWSEIAAMIAPLVIYPIARFGFGLRSPITLYPTVLGTTIVWLIATFLTRPTTKETLARFYERAHPGGRGWRRVAAALPHVKSDTGFGRMFVNWLCGVVLVYTALFGVGKLLFADWLPAVLFLGAGVIAAFVLYRNLSAVEAEERPRA
jgi:Na+/proline symporter